MAMMSFQQVATEQLKLLFFIFVLGTGLQAVPANPSATSACGSEFYPNLLAKHYLLAVELFASAMLLLVVRMAISTAEANAIAAAGRRALDGDLMGLASVLAGWKSRSLRALLYIAVHLSCAATYLAIVALEDGFIYRTGCHRGYSIRTVVLDGILTCLVTVVFAFSGRVAMVSHS